MVKAMMASIGLDPARFGAHSLRIGGATAALAAGLSPAAIRAAGRWASDVYMLYTRCNMQASQRLATVIGSTAFEDLQRGVHFADEDGGATARPGRDARRRGRRIRRGRHGSRRVRSGGRVGGRKATPVGWRWEGPGRRGGQAGNGQAGPAARAVASVCGGIRRVRRPPALWSHRGAGARMPIPLGEESA